MATPRNLDPKFKDETARPETEEERQARMTEEERERETREKSEKDQREKDETPMIVHRERYVDEAGKLNEREHRMPVSEWAAYEKEHNL